MIIGIAGKARSGKDTVAGMLLSEDPSFSRYNLADPIKACINEMFGLDERHSDGALKEVVLPIEYVTTEFMKLTIWKHFSDHMAYKELRYCSEAFQKMLDQYIVEGHDLGRNARVNCKDFYLVSPRELYQWFGTDIMRHLVRDTFWLDVVDTNRNYIIPDIRFENEAEWVRENGFLIHLERGDAIQVAKHESENGVGRLDNESVIVNNGSLGELNTEALKVLYDMMEIV